MKSRIKYAFALCCLLTIGIISINLYNPNREQQVKGSIELLVNENSYDYLVECANNFMKANDKTSINVKKLDDYNLITTKVQESSKTKNPIVAQIDRFNFAQLKLDDYGYYTKYSELLNNYAKNFSKYRLDQVKQDDKIIGIPLNSRPLALYIREDMLKEYGYKRENMNTWDDVIKVGKDIYTKSNGKVSIVNATGQDYEDLIDLLTMENFSEEKSIEQIKSEVEAMIKNLKDNNILNLQDGGEFLARISSINAMKEIMALDEKCEWDTGNVPSIKAGTNKFFACEGDNLLILNQSAENEKLIEKFITYVITNNQDTTKYVKNGQFFSSYLSIYNNKEIEDSVKNFVGKSPLVILSNVEEKTLEITDYDKYIKVKQELRGINN